MFANKKIHQFARLSTFLLVIMTAISFINPAQAIEYGMLGGKPANPDPNIPDSSSWFIYNLAPGEKKDDVIEVMNLYEKPFDVLIYASDGTKSSGGGFALKQFAESKDEVGKWVKFYPEEVPAAFKGLLDSMDGKISKFCDLSIDELQVSMKKKKVTDDEISSFQNWCQGSDKVELNLDAKVNQKIPFVFSVPEGTDVGEHTGGILIQKVQPEDSATQEGSAVKLTTRVGVRIYETVPGQIVKNLRMGDFEIVKNYSEFNFARWFEKDPKPEDLLVQGKVVNSGNVSVDFQNIIKIKDDLFGKRTQEIDDRNFQVLKGDTFISNYSWQNPRFGKFTFSMGLSYKNDKGEVQSTFSNPVTVWIFPWREIVTLLVFGLLFAGAYFWWKSYQKKKYGGIGWVEYKLKKTDTIAKISEKHNVDWNVLVKTNKLKPPYLLEAGAIILVPADPKKVAVASEEKILETGTKKATPAKAAVKVKPAAKAKTVKALSAPEQKTIWNDLTKKYFVWVSVAILVTLSVVAFVKMQKNSKSNTISTDISISDLGTTKEQSQITMTNQSVTKVEEPSQKTTGNIVILNGGGAPGSAGKLSDFLKAADINVTETKNAESDDQSGVVIYFQPEYEMFADKVLEKIKLKYADAEVKAAESSQEKSSDLVIILGK